MSSKWFWGLLVLFLVGGLSAGLLYRRYKILHNKPVTGPVSETETLTQEFGSTLLTYSQPAEGEKEILRSVVFNKLIIEDFSLDEVELNGEKKPVLILTVAFDYQGKSRQLTIPIVDTILFSELGPQGFEKGKFISVESINFEKGKEINIKLSYVPKESSSTKEELIKFCGDRGYGLCLMYVELEFGDNPADLGAYLENLFEGEDKGTLDYKTVFPDTIFLLAD